MWWYELDWTGSREGPIKQALVNNVMNEEFCLLGYNYMQYVESQSHNIKLFMATILIISDQM
jgi:hypothetical protein